MAVKSSRRTSATRETNVTGETKAYRFQYRTRTRVACLALAFCLISLPMPAISVKSASEFTIDALTWPVSLIRRKRSKPVRQPAVQETPVDRVGHVSSIRITPPKHVGRQGQTIALRGLPLDSSGRVVEGVRIYYSSSDAAILTVDSGSGIAALLQPGVAWVTAAAGTVGARVPILVLAGSRAMQTDAQWDSDQAMLNPDGTLATGVGSNGLIPSLLEKLAATV